MQGDRSSKFNRHRHSQSEFSTLGSGRGDGESFKRVVSEKSLLFLAGGDRRAHATQLQDEFREQQGDNPRCPADCDSAVGAGLKTRAWIVIVQYSEGHERKCDYIGSYHPFLVDLHLPFQDCVECHARRGEPGGPEDSNREVVRVSDAVTRKSCFDWLRSFPMTLSRGRFATISPSGELVAITAENKLSIYRLPAVCEGPTKTRDNYTQGRIHRDNVGIAFGKAWKRGN